MIFDKLAIEAAAKAILRKKAYAPWDSLHEGVKMAWRTEAADVLTAAVESLRARGLVDDLPENCSMAWTDYASGRGEDHVVSGPATIIKTASPSEEE